MAGASNAHDAAETSWPNWEWPHVEEGGVQDRRTSWDFAKDINRVEQRQQELIQVGMHPIGRRWRKNTAVRFEAKLGGNPIYKTPSIIAAHDMVACVLHPAALLGQGADIISQKWESHKRKHDRLCGKGPKMKPQQGVVY